VAKRPGITYLKLDVPPESTEAFALLAVLLRELPALQQLEVEVSTYAGPQPALPPVSSGAEPMAAASVVFGRMALCTAAGCARLECGEQVLASC